MAFIDEAVGNSYLQFANRSEMTQTTAAINDVKKALAAQFWAWFRGHADDVLLDRKVLFFSLKIRVRDLRFLWEELFGQEVTL